MKFLRQLKSEIRNIIKSKFLLIIGILIIAAGAIVPIIGLFTQPATGGSPEPTIYRDMMYASSYKGDFYPGNGGQEPITIDGVTIYGDNPFYWNLTNLIQEKDSIENGGYSVQYPETLDILLEINALDTAYFLRFAKSVTNYADYRVDLAWRGTESLYDKYFYENNDVEISVLLEASMYKKGMDEASFRKKFIDITSAEKLAAIDVEDENLNMIYDIVDNDNFPRYIELRIRLENDQIISYQDNIAILEQNIIDNPDQEDNLNQQIKEIRKQITLIETNNIPLLQYRLEKNIKPGENVWQNNALADVENSRNQLVYLVILTEEEWNNNGGGGPFYPLKEPGGVGSGQTYEEYVASMQKQIDQVNTVLIIAQKSLDSDQPDMKYVPNGARSRTNSYLDYSLIVSLFAVLLGGWLIASEFQQGTIRLLMIRPKTRTKILMSKFLAALLIILFIDFAGSLLNIIVNGICYGFGDFAFPNYTISASVNFFAYFIPAFLICIVPIIFAFTLSFMLSTVVRNSAVSIAIPIVLFVASIVTMGTFVAIGYFGYGADGIGWLAWTPIPFIQISSFFQPNSIVQMLTQYGATISLPYGIVLLLVLSVICTVVSILVFKKRDIAN